MQQAKHDFTVGRNGAGDFVFQGRTEAGRKIGVAVSPEYLRKLAAAMELTDSPGHAVWHVENPDAPVPCYVCENGQGAKKGGIPKPTERFAVMSGGMEYGPEGWSKYFETIADGGTYGLKEAGDHMIELSKKYPDYGFSIVRITTRTEKVATIEDGQVNYNRLVAI